MICATCRRISSSAALRSDIHQHANVHAETHCLTAMMLAPWCRASSIEQLALYERLTTDAISLDAVPADAKDMSVHSFGPDEGSNMRMLSRQSPS